MLVLWRRPIGVLVFASDIEIVCWVFGWARLDDVLMHSGESTQCHPVHVL